MDVKNQKISKDYALYNGDCCNVITAIPNESVGFSIFSPPFSNLYSYSDENADMSNAKTHKEFFQHFEFLVKELHRVTMNGRMVAVHCMDLPILKQNSGYIGLSDFSGRIIRIFEKVGMIFYSRHCIWKDPLLAGVRTKAIGLAHKQIVKDSSVCRMGIPDYILGFRKRGENPKPIKHKNGLETYYGSRNIPNHLKRYRNEVPGKNKFAHWIWRQYASPVWFDIRQTRVLNFRKARDHDDEKHICPLQLDVIERCVELWTTEDDTVLSPFMGIGSEIFVAVKNKRKGIGIELKTSYYKQAVQNIKKAKEKKKNTLL